MTTFAPNFLHLSTFVKGATVGITQVTGMPSW
jgi:hypothetical protein